MPKPKVRAAPTKSHVKPAVSRKNKPAPKHVPKPKPRTKPMPRPRQSMALRPIESAAEKASIQEWVSVQREKERRAAELEAAEAKAARNRYQAQVNAELRNYAQQTMLAYRIQQDPRQQKANEVMREEDMGHVDTIYSEEDLNEIEDMFGPFTYSHGTSQAVNPMQVQELRERIRVRKTQNTEKKRRGTFKARKHAGKGSIF